MRKKVWVNTVRAAAAATQSCFGTALPPRLLTPACRAAQGDIVLVGLRDFQDEKADVILKYMADEARSLKAYGELPESIRVNETDTFDEERGDNEDFFGARRRRRGAHLAASHFLLLALQISTTWPKSRGFADHRSHCCNTGAWQTS